MIKNGMWDIFYLTDPCNPECKWDLFYNNSRFPLKYVVDLIQKTKNDPSACDTYGLQNLEWSGEYLRNSLSAELLNKVLREVPFDCFWA